MLVGPSRDKNPNGRRQSSGLFYTRGLGFELGTTEDKSRNLNSRNPNCKSSALTTGPRYLLLKEKTDQQI